MIACQSRISCAPCIRCVLHGRFSPCSETLLLSTSREQLPPRCLPCVLPWTETWQTPGVPKHNSSSSSFMLAFRACRASSWRCLSSRLCSLRENRSPRPQHVKARWLKWPRPLAFFCCSAGRLSNFILQVTLFLSRRLPAQLKCAS